jgi:hypothetical protein
MAATRVVRRTYPDAQRFPSSPPVVCAVVIFLRTGLDEYKVYTLEGGP